VGAFRSSGMPLGLMRPQFSTSQPSLRNAAEAAQNFWLWHVDADGPDLFNAACSMGLEGMVSKHRDRPYRAGRSPHWIKVKNPTSPAMKDVAG
jgi:hypothetical protein